MNWRPLIVLFLLLVPCGLLRASDSLNNMDPTTVIYTKADVDAAFQPLDTDLTAIAGLTSAADRLPYATGVGTWGIMSFPPFAQTLVDDTSPGAARTTLGLGGLATLSVVGSGEVTNGSVANVDLADMGQSTFKGRAAGAGTGVPVDLTATQATAILDGMVGDSGAGGTKGLVPAPAAGDTAAGKFLKADGTWSAPSGTGAPTDPQYLTLAAHSGISSERVLTLGAGLAGTDAGAGGAYTVVPTERFDAVLYLVNTTTVTLGLMHNTGQIIEVAGTSIRAQDLTSASLTTSENLITSTGADAGAAMGTSTTYYVYVSSPAASYAPSEVKASTTGPSLGSTSLYLGTSGNALQWRFAGMVRTNASTQFVDSATQRFVWNQYNRRPLRLHTCPGKNDNNAATSWTTTSTTWTSANTGTGSKIEWISNLPLGSTYSKTAAHFVAQAHSANSGANVNYIGIGFSSTTTATVEALVNPANTVGATITCSCVREPTAGYEYAELLVRVSAGTGTYYADDARGGGSADPDLTFLSGWIDG